MNAMCKKTASETLKTSDRCKASTRATASNSRWSQALEPLYWDQRYASSELVWTGDANHTLVAETKGLLPGYALDLASGEGRNAIWLAEQGWSVRAVDFSSVATEKATRLAKSRHVDHKVDFETADLRVFAPGLQYYDLVTLLYLQIPRAELNPILVKAASAVAPGGTFLLVAHDSENLEHGFGGPQQADMLYTTAQVVAALGGELAIEKASRIERPVETKEGIKIAIDCVVRGKRL